MTQNYNNQEELVNNQEPLAAKKDYFDLVSL